MAKKTTLIFLIFASVVVGIIALGALVPARAFVGCWEYAGAEPVTLTSVSIVRFSERGPLMIRFDTKDFGVFYMDHNGEYTDIQPEGSERVVLDSAFAIFLGDEVGAYRLEFTNNGKVSRIADLQVCTMLAGW